MRNYSFEEKAYIWLSMAVNSAVTRSRLVSMVSSATELFNDFDEIKLDLLSSGKDELVQKLEEVHDINLINSFIERNNKNDIDIITFESPNFPQCLKHIENPPTVLFCKGDLSLFNSKKLAVVGPRDITRYGLDVAENFVREFAKTGLVVVSGIARGVDTVAHKTAIGNKGKTIAVLPCGLDKIYPSENKDLYLDIIENGLLVSEYPLGSTVKQFTFQERNRIVSGLAEAVLLPECKISGGTTITAECAIEQGKKLFAVPGNIYNKMSEGCNRYIKQQKAIMVLEPKEVLVALNVTPPKKEKVKAVQLSTDEILVMEALKKEDQHFETLLKITCMTSSELSILLFNLELKGLVKKLPGNYYGI